MDEKLIHILREITPEENQILNGNKEVQKNLYTNDSDFTVDSKKMLTEGELIAVRTHTRFVHFPLHRHNYVEVIYVCEGSITNVIDEKKVEICKGELLFLNQFTSHEILPAKETDIAINFIILPEFFDVAYSMVGAHNVLANFLVTTLRQRQGKGEYLYFKVSEVLQIQNLIENMIYSLVYHQENTRMLNQTTMGLLFQYLIESVQYVETLVPNKYENMIIMTTLDYVEQKYKTASLTKLSEMLHQPIHQLSKMIKKNTGYNFTELLQRKRLNKAVELLCETDLAVNDIIFSVGYENNSYFHRMFKGRYEMTPKAFRDAHKNEEQIRM
ncbi:MAG: AraC family transcriptional regulator [Lachnospiraceae bacterium]